MILWILAFVVVGIAGGIGVGMIFTSLRARHSRILLGIPDSADGDLGALKARLAARSVADTEMQINAAAPNLKPQHRRRLALALTRSRGLLSRKAASPD